uniref:PRA1 family protein n=1 Tax=Calcidiscus leptoporus TaxID=127549 RepID=A0A7S0IKP1_9EUKA|mmetsp:Transcript_11945/g.27654  ORF Transcript_11945/g.27654 Transcript_11945/m.27654 type:complete len:203 (+) Transcript_11945:131-739(+)|eukprot:CAMPEP_0119358532 /NCGR_PEP_ID=MMETSP1334-20130426/6723_1 /TAXON_ID=127549 /ORGANISM="Calcidiscus leptoporus, Strain RCC1130" /LENGTH=202 /DNA_ID=CAMNT_0007373055 /DNA_START=118 /DNA_END=726 /DNA_ORIENTATION=+
MGNIPPTARLQRLMDLGFTVAEARIALAEADGDVDRAAAILERRRNLNAKRGFAERVNGLLREQRPWAEFFDRFLWPEHLNERVNTNLMYYRGNYIVLCAGLVLLHMLIRPAMLLVGSVAAGLPVLALSWGETPVLGQPLDLTQRLVAAGLASALLLHWSGYVWELLGLAGTCSGIVLAHATFRARSLSSRWKFFNEQMKAE